MLIEGDVVLVSTVEQAGIFHKIIDDENFDKKGLLDEDCVLTSKDANPFDKTLRYDNGINIRSLPDRISIYFNIEDHENSIKDTAGILRGISQELKKYKFSALGINFASFFKCEDASKRIYESLVDKNALTSDFDSSSLNIMKSISGLSSIDTTLNMQFSEGNRIYKGNNETGLVIKYNYHHEINSISDANSILSKATEYKKNAENLLRQAEKVLGVS